MKFQLPCEMTSTHSNALLNSAIRSIPRECAVENEKSRCFRAKFAAMAAGNILEWYDFAVFGAVADLIGDSFSPANSSDSVRIMLAFGVFGSAFIMRYSAIIYILLYNCSLPINVRWKWRPVGGILGGYIGDTISRKKQLEISGSYCCWNKDPQNLLSLNFESTLITKFWTYTFIIISCYDAVFQ